MIEIRIYQWLGYKTISFIKRYPDLVIKKKRKGMIKPIITPFRYNV